MERLSNFRSKRNKLRVLWKSRELKFLFPLVQYRQFYEVYAVHNAGVAVPLSSKTTPIIFMSLSRSSSASYGIYIDNKNELRLGIVTVSGGRAGLQIAADDPKGRDGVLLDLTMHLIEKVASGRQCWVDSYVAKCAKTMKGTTHIKTRTLEQMLILSRARIQAIASEAVNP